MRWWLKATPSVLGVRRSPARPPFRVPVRFMTCAEACSMSCTSVQLWGIEISARQGADPPNEEIRMDLYRDLRYHGRYLNPIPAGRKGPCPGQCQQA